MSGGSTTRRRRGRLVQGPRWQHLRDRAAGVNTIPAPRAGRREWIRLAAIALPCMVYALDLTVLNLALPALSEDLQPSSAQLLWIVDIYRGGPPGSDQR